MARPRYIKGFKTTADFLLDTSFTYELGLIAKLLRPVSQRFTLEGHNAELWDETARRFEHVAPGGAGASARRQHAARVLRR